MIKYIRILRNNDAIIGLQKEFDNIVRETIQTMQFNSVRMNCLLQKKMLQEYPNVPQKNREMYLKCFKEASRKIEENHTRLIKMMESFGVDSANDCSAISGCYKEKIKIQYNYED